MPETILNVEVSARVHAQKIIDRVLDPLPRPGETLDVEGITFDVADVTHVLATGNVVLDLRPILAADEDAERLAGRGFTVLEPKAKEKAPA